MANVGFATLTVIPVVKGIKGELDKQVGGELVASGRKAGKDAGDAIAAGLAQAESKVKASSAKLAAARDKEADAAGKLRIAEAKLQELRDKGITSGSRLVAAEEALRRAQVGSSRATEAARKEVDQLTKARADLANATRDAANEAEKQGGKAGSGFSGKFKEGLGSITDGIKALPIAGAFAAIGVGAVAAFAGAVKDGMGQELSRDLFQAQTGATEGEARRFATAAAEAYVNVFGESVEANLATAKTALHFDIIDADATQGEAQHVIQMLQTIADVAETETEDVSRAVGSLINAGMAEGVNDASDLITRATQMGLNRQGDLIDSISEYSAGWKNTGLSAETTMALIGQSLDNGADNTDRAADALREFGRRMYEESDTIVTAVNDIGLNGEEMYERLSKGGPDAEKAFDEIFDGLRTIEDQQKRNAIAQALLGDTAGDFIGAFTQWDPSEAVAKFGDVQGAAQRAMDVMGNNSATKVEGAMRTIGQAFDDVKGALAEALGPQIQEWADGISGSREKIVEVFFAIGEGALTAAEYVLKFGEYGARATAAILDGLAFIAPAAYVAAAAMASATGNFDLAGDLMAKSFTVGDSLSEAADGVRGFADNIRDNAIPAVQGMKESFNGMEERALATAKVSDAMKVLAADSNVTVTEVDRVKDAMDAEARAMYDAGASTEEINSRHQEHIGNLRGVLEALGVNNSEIDTYISKLDSIPPEVNTRVIIDQILRDATDGGAAQGRAANEQEVGGAAPGTTTTVNGVQYEAGPDGILRQVPAQTGSGLGRSEVSRQPPRTGAGIGDADTWGLNSQQRAFWESFSAQFPEASITDAGIRTFDDGTNGASYHYSGQALDIAGPNMQAYTEWIAANDPSATELFYDPWGGLKNGEQIGAIGAHGDHVHYVPSGAAGTSTADPAGDIAAAESAGTSAGTAAASGSSGGSSGGGGGTDWGQILQDAAVAQIDDAFSVFGFSGSPRWLGMALDGMSGGGGGGGSSSSSSSSATATGETAESGTSSTTAGGDTLSAAASQYGWDSGSERAALDELMRRESGGNPTAQNPSSTAYGRWQFLDSTWDDVGGTKTSDPALQDQYGMAYIQQRYGSPSAALAFHDANNYYHDGGTVRGYGDVGAVLQGGEEVIRNGPAQEFRSELKDINAGRGRRGGNQYNTYNVKGYEPHVVVRELSVQQNRSAMRFRRQTARL